MRENISFIGSGNVAWHLAPALDNVGFVVKEVYSRNRKHAHALTKRLYQAEVNATLDFSESSSSVFIIAVNDESICTIAKEIVLPDEAILVHTSGSVSLEDLQFAATPNLGVFYPLQSFTKERKMDFRQVPIFIESANEETANVLSIFAKAIGSPIQKINSEQRIALHIAAVMASNFVTQLLALSKNVMQQHDLQFDWLKPLISESINKSLQLNPEEALTGPARRGDMETVAKHLDFLKDDPAVAEIYNAISRNIIDHFHN